MPMLSSMKMRSRADAVPPAEPSFQSDAHEALRAFRDAVRALFLALHPGAKTTPTSLRKTLHVDYAVCWQLVRIAHTDAIMTQAVHAPSPAGLKRVLEASQGLGVPGPVVQAVRESAERLHSVIKHHAGDRTAFGSMLAGVAPSASAAERLDLKHRRAIYRGISHLWGMQIDTSYSMQIFHPAATSDRAELCAVGSKLGVRRLRPDAPVVIGGYLPDIHRVDEPLDVTANQKFGVPLLPQFSSNPMPPLRNVPQPSGWVFHELQGHSVGLRASSDFTFARINRNAVLGADGDGPQARTYLHNSFLTNTPTGLLILELLVHRPRFGSLVPTVALLRKTPDDESASAPAAASALPCFARVEKYSASNPPEMREVPFHRDLLGCALGYAGWNAADFDLFRVRLDYPPIYSALRLFARNESRS